MKTLICPICGSEPADRPTYYQRVWDGYSCIPDWYGCIPDWSGKELICPTCSTGLGKLYTLVWQIFHMEHSP